MHSGNPETIPSYPREAISRFVVDVMIRGRNAFHPSLYEVELEGRRAVWKDVGDRAWPFRKFFGSVLLREARALHRLRSLESVPRLYGLVGRDGYVMEKLDAHNLPSRRMISLSEEFFATLRQQIQAMHGLGVAHGDLRRMNILLEDATNRPKLIDFGTAMIAGEKSNPMMRSMWRKSRRIDLKQYAKLKNYYLPGSLTAEEQRWLDYSPFFYRIGHWFRWYIYKPMKWRNLQKKFRHWWN